MVHVISESRLREFWESRKKDSRVTERDLTTWYKLAKKAEWANFGELNQKSRVFSFDGGGDSGRGCFTGALVHMISRRLSRGIDPICCKYSPRASSPVAWGNVSSAAVRVSSRSPWTASPMAFSVWG